MSKENNNALQKAPKSDFEAYVLKKAAIKAAVMVGGSALLAIGVSAPRNHGVEGAMMTPPAAEAQLHPEVIEAANAANPALQPTPAEVRS